MTRNLSIAVIGAGVMGGAIIGGLLRQEIVSPNLIIAADPHEERRHELQALYHIRVSSDNLEAAAHAQTIIFAVKPQVIANVLRPLHNTLPKETLCISVIAGSPISTFTSILHHQTVVRAMPNTPAQIGEGMTVWTATPEVTREQRQRAQKVLESLGRERFVESEHYLDMATAISGSGPAYVFLMMESMIDAGVHLGFSRPVAEELVFQTLFGSVRYAQQSGSNITRLRHAVTSPGGTTAAGVSELELGGLRATISNAIWAAYNRSCELGSQGKSENR
jgi:pyrroline-5-carboxylate reductase